jgi:hypothetical protein
MAGVSKADIKSKLAKVMKTKEECINIYGLKNKFGGGRSSGFALIYDSVDARKKYDTKTSLRRVSYFFTLDAIARSFRVCVLNSFKLLINRLVYLINRFRTVKRSAS